MSPDVRYSTGSRLRGWKVTSDGTFWGGILMFSSVSSLVAVIFVTARQF